ncbi:pleckstrin homology domain-containing family F member 2-like [Nelusetta ayraudi]|uniref:pleckstrin homology domain-containing family F member 2-like n=1 Tax=Nelusetta ayraudi TaxID=303726 RepID=UPI003F728CAB
MDSVAFDKKNTERIKAVESSFASGSPLSKPGRVLIGHGRLVKQCRRRPAPKVFFLFNDLLVYGSIIVSGRWHKKQKVIPLEDIQLQDMEDGDVMRNQWLIRTPAKSFFVSAATFDEKRAWMANIQSCQASLVQGATQRPASDYAVTWIPDGTSERCLRCFAKFTVAVRRHHCRRCGFLVCDSCSKQKVVIRHISPTEKQRVCKLCHDEVSKEEEKSRLRWDSTGKSSSDDEDEAFPDDNSQVYETPQTIITESHWLDPWMIY